MTKKEIYSILKKLNKEDKKTIISIEHNLDIALNNSTHILKIENAGVKLFTVDEFKEFRKESFNN